MVILFVLLVIAAGFCCTSCENHARPVTYSIFDVPLDSVTGEVWFPELLADAFGMVNLSSKLCFIGPDKQHLVYLVDEKTGKEWGYAGIVGQGPEDMQARPQYVGKSAKGDTIRLYDYNERKLNTYWVTQTADGLPNLKLVEKKSLLDTNTKPSGRKATMCWPSAPAAAPPAPSAPIPMHPAGFRKSSFLPWKPTACWCWRSARKTV